MKFSLFILKYIGINYLIVKQWLKSELVTRIYLFFTIRNRKARKQRKKMTIVTDLLLIMH